MKIGNDGGAGATSAKDVGLSESLAHALEQVSALRESVERMSDVVNSVIHNHTPNFLDSLSDFGTHELLGAAMLENEALTQSLSGFNMQNEPTAQRQHDLDTLHALAQIGAMGTIFTEEQTSQAFDMLAAMLRTAPAFQGVDKFQNFAAIAPIILRAPEVAQMRNLGSLDDNMRALVQYAHLTGDYTPAGMTRRTDQLLAIAEAVGLPFGQLERIMSMAIPMARSVGASVSETALLTAALVQGGLGGRSGFAMGQIFSGLLQTGGPLSATLQNELESVNRSLGGTAHRFTHSEMNEHIAGLVRLGLMNSLGQLTVLNSAGGVDIARVVTDIDASGHRMDPIAFGNALRNAFSVRGQRGAELLKVMDQLTPALFAAVNSTPGAAAQQAAFAATPLQQFEQVIARLEDIGNILATTILPDFLLLEGGLLAFLNAVDDFLAKHKFLASLIGHTLIGTAGGFAVGGPGGAFMGATVGAVKAIVDDISRPRAVPPGSPFAVLLAPQNAEKEAPNVTVNAPLTVTVQGDMLGDYANLSAFLSQWWAQNAGAVGNAVQQQIRQMQRQSRRMTMRDMQQADGYTAAIADGAGYR